MSSDKWNPHFLEGSRLFNYLKPVADQYSSFSTWPTLKQLQQQFKQHDLDVTPVPQAERHENFSDHYEPRIYLKKELQTRAENWHDFFNAMIWLSFPQTKSVLNQLHYHAALKRKPGTNRSPIENAITLFDECGIIIISKHAGVLDMIRKHEWKQLFIDNRSLFEHEIQCVVFGHAMYEKALTPYVGMTCQALLIQHEPLENDRYAIDKLVNDQWQQSKIKTTKDLYPFPVLGVPGWHQGNDEYSFYDNKGYFRPLSKNEFKG